VVGVFAWMTAVGTEEKIKKTKNFLFATLVALVITFIIRNSRFSI